MIKDLKKQLENAQKNYKNGIKNIVKTVIDKILKDIDIDIENNTYYIEMMTENQAEVATDKQFNEYENKYHEVYAMLKKVKQELFEVLKDADEWANVSVELYNDNTISIEIKVDGFEFEIQLENKYNK